MEQRRKNPLLSQFYFAEGKAAAAAPAPVQPSNPLDINSSSFSSNSYFQTLLKERSLVELVTIDNNLRQTVRTLDNGLKTLVYENYNKFISATETIKSMKSTVEKMESDMMLLSKNMSNIDSICANVDAKMAPRRDKIDQLSGVFRLLQGRQFLFELPTRLKKDLTQGNFADAVKYYLMTMDVLKSYEHLPSFLAINDECKATMSELKGRLWQRAEDPSTSAVLFAEAVGLLVDLQCDQKKLRALFAQHSQARFDSSFKEAAEEVSVLSANVLPVVVSIGASYLACFVDRPVLTSTEAGDAKRELLEMLDRFVDLYYVEVQRLLAETNDVAEVVAAIANMSNSLCDAMAKLPVKFGEHKVSDLVNASIRSYINRDLASVQQETKAAIDNSLSSTNTAAQASSTASAVICQCVSAFLDNLRPMVDPKWTVGRDPLAVVRQIAVKLAGLFTGVASHALGIASRENALMLSGLCLLVEQQVIPLAKEGLAGLAVLAQSQPSAVDPQFRASELASILHGGATTLLQSFVSSCSARLAKLVTRSIDAGNWMSPELASVRKPRMVVSVLMDDLLAVQKSVDELFGSSKKPPLDRNNSNSVRGQTYGVTKDEMRVLFNDRIKIFTLPADFSSGAVLFCILKVVVKAWIESLRTRVLCRNALHQMQVDQYALREAVAKMLTGEPLRLVESLFEQVEKSAEDRSVEPIPLEQSVAKKIIAEHNAQK